MNLTRLLSNCLVKEKPFQRKDKTIPTYVCVWAGVGLDRGRNNRQQIDRRPGVQLTVKQDDGRTE